MDHLLSAKTALRGCEAQLKHAYSDAANATARVSGARAARAIELLEKIADAIQHAHRLAIIVEGDHRTEVTRKS
jgi:hypothetical protein